MTDADKIGRGAIRTRIMCTMGGVLQVDVKNNEILRVRPLQLAEDDVTHAKWKIEAGGRTFSPPARTTVAPFAIASRRLVDNPHRIKYPMIRSKNRNWIYWSPRWRPVLTVPSLQVWAGFLML